MQNIVNYRGMVLPSRIAAAISKLRNVKEKTPTGFIGVSPNKPVWPYKCYWPYSTIEGLRKDCFSVREDIHVYDFSQEKIVAGLYLDNVQE